MTILFNIYLLQLTLLIHTSYAQIYHGFESYGPLPYTIDIFKSWFLKPNINQCEVYEDKRCKANQRCALVVHRTRDYTYQTQLFDPVIRF